MIRSAIRPGVPRVRGVTLRRTLFVAAVCWPFTPPLTLAEAQRPRRAPEPLTVPAPPGSPTVPAPPAAPITWLGSVSGAFAGLAIQPRRAALGVGLRVGGSRADTLGLEIGEVTPDGPAARAGLTAGMHIEAINGVSVRLSADDADDPLTADAGFRRLQRVMAQVEPGGEVELRIRDGAVRRTVSVTTVSTAELSRARAVTVAGGVRGLRESLANRAALGLGVTSSGTARDTLGVFITAVTSDGPADSAGVIEGERIAVVNGVDVRVPVEDIGDAQAGAARLSRFLRTLDGVSPGDRVTLRVFGGGRYREVALTAGKASELGGRSLRLRLPGIAGGAWQEIADNQTAPFRVY